MPIKKWILCCWLFLTPLYVFANTEFNGMWLGTETITFKGQHFEEKTNTVIFQENETTLALWDPLFNTIRLTASNNQWILQQTITTTFLGVDIHFTEIELQFQDAEHFTATLNGSGTQAGQTFNVTATLSHQKQTCQTIENNTQLSGLAGGFFKVNCYEIELPPATANFQVQTAGGFGEVDLLVIHAQPDFPHQESLSETAEEFVQILSPVVGKWYINVIHFLSAGIKLDVKFSDRIVLPEGALESPQANSFESGIGLIRGWICDATKVELKIDDLPALQAAYGSPREDTMAICGDNDNGFGLTVNWNLLTDGNHTLKVFVDNIEFSSTPFTITTLGSQFLTNINRDFVITDFPQTDAADITISWSESHQNFIITSDNSASATGTLGDATHQLESPQLGSAQSGIGLIRGWVCNATKIEIKIDDFPKIQAAYGTTRQDTLFNCGDDDNGFGLTVNWNLLGDGNHTLQAFADNVEFANTQFSVTTLGSQFLQNAHAEYTFMGFPDIGNDVTLRWSEAHQNFVLVNHQ